MLTQERIEALTEQLLAVIRQKLCIGLDQSAVTVYMQKRLENAAIEAVPLISQLTEPWHTCARAPQVVFLSAQLHVYARILDDALDENLPIHRLILLRSQAWYWECVYQLGQLYPQYQIETTALIQETIAAVEQEENLRQKKILHVEDLSVWAEKNHHLLIAPLLLSENNLCYQQNRFSLSFFVLLLQAREELSQQSWSPQTYTVLFGFLRQYLREPTWIGQLAQAGWSCIAGRILPIYDTIFMSLKPSIDLEDELTYDAKKSPF